ncbi:putative Nucleoside phosphorylase [Candidatus Zixiibacteriota bacterium]|nr:putative Nucleoside phosphorylase [candidate division Zixibacteria bacterium]
MRRIFAASFNPPLAAQSLTGAYLIPPSRFMQFSHPIFVAPKNPNPYFSDNRISLEDTMKRTFIFSLLSLVWIASTIFASEHRPVLVLYAFPAEGKLLQQEMTTVKSEKILGRTIFEGILSGQEIVLAESGVGMTNAAMTTQRLIDLCRPSAVLFTGIAGGIDSTVHIGDIVVCRKWATHDYGYYGAEGFKISGIGAYYPKADSEAEMDYFPVDSALFEKALAVNRDSLKFDSIGNHLPHLKIGGVGVSGNSFIDNVVKRQWLSSNFAAEVVDMESASVAQVCTVNDIPFIIFRSASDLAGGSGSATAQSEMGQFFKNAAANSAEVVKMFLAKW